MKLGLTLREKHRLRILKNRVLRKITGSQKQKVKGGWTNTTMKSFIICTHPCNIIKVRNRGRLDG